ncbi:MAG: PLP-dependent transferase [Bacteroidia bacterium]|nr:MAG: PLP-dependent transferase [Bacteroidia bacterium]
MNISKEENTMKNRREINSSRVPIYRETGFELTNAEITSQTFESETGHEREPGRYIYSRYRNPTVVAAEEGIMQIEGSAWALLAQSGMAAIDIALSIFQEKDDIRPWVFFSEIYGGTNSYIDSVLQARRGIEVVKYEPYNNTYDLAAIESLIAEKRPSVLYFEVISNPMLIIADAREIIKIAKRYGVYTIVDNTFSTPVLYRPLSDGADIVIHSATKYLAGHGNITAGALCGDNPELLKRAIEYRKFVGHMLSPDDAYRLTTQMQSFNLRFRQQCINASALAIIFENNPNIDKVLYPGIDKHQTHSIASSLFGSAGYGAMITFSFGGYDQSVKRGRRDRFIEAVSNDIKLIPTLGDSHTILMPVEPVWGYKYPEPGMIRMSVGFEETAHLAGIIERGLSLVI